MARRRQRSTREESESGGESSTRGRGRARRDDSPPTAAQLDQGGSADKGRERLAALANSLGRRWGASTALPLSIAPVARIMRLPFGILMLDWLTGGGLVIGRINRLVGPKSTLKSTLCLRALRSAQQHCRHCKFPMVRNPQTGVVDCRCPKPRWWLANEDDYQWLPHETAIEVAYGKLPGPAAMKNVQGLGRVPVLKCAPPEHLTGGRRLKEREIAFKEAPRNEPMRCLYLDSEGTIDEAWARANGVDPSLVLLVGARWGEQSLATVEEAVLTREFDFIVIDSTSVLTPKKELEKSITEGKKVAAHAALMSQFAKRHIAAAFDEGLTGRYRPTVLTTSQVTTKGIGGGKKAHAYLDSTDGNAMNHAVSLDIAMKEEGYTFDASKRFAVHGDFGFKVKKNKAGGGTPGATGTIRFWLKAAPDHPVGDSDDLTVVMNYAREASIKLLEEGTGAAKLTLHSPYVPDGQMVFQRVGDAETFLRENVTVYNDLRERVLAKLMQQDIVLALPNREGETVAPDQARALDTTLAAHAAAGDGETETEEAEA
jgi:RecA/RadA recombinase